MMSGDRRAPAAFKPSTLLLYYGASLLSLLLIQAIVALTGDRNLPPTMPMSRLWINVVLVNLVTAYFFVCGSVREQDLQKNWIYFFLFVLALLCTTPPGFGGDFNEYLIRGRIFSVYGKNPYLTTPEAFSHDMLYPLCFWKNTTETYGPLFVFLEAIPSRLFPTSLLAETIVLKLIMLSFYSLGVYFFYKIGKEFFPDQARRVTAIYALNPLLILRSLIDAHNDIIMLSLSITAVYFFLRSKYARSFMALSAAFSVKITAVFLFPALLLQIFVRKRGQGIAKALGLCLFQVGVILVSLFCLYAPLWAGFATFKVVFDASQWFYNNSIPYLFYLGLSKVGVVLDTVRLQAVFKYLLVLGYAALMGFMAMRKPLSPRDLCRFLFCIYALVYLTLTSPLQSHYLLWGLPWLILSFWPRRQMLIVALYTLTGAFCYFKRVNFLFLLSLTVYLAVVGKDIFLSKRSMRGLRSA